MENLKEQSSAEFLAEKQPSINEPSHFDGLINDTRKTEQRIEVVTQQSNMIDKEGFHELFCGGFNVAHHMSGLKSLAVDKSDGKSIAASGALYDTIQDIPMLHFLLMPQGKWMERAVAIGMFTIPMAQNVAAELAQRHAEQPQSTENDMPQQEDVMSQFRQQRDERAARMQ